MKKKTSFEIMTAAEESILDIVEFVLSECPKFAGANELEMKCRTLYGIGIMGGKSINEQVNGSTVGR